MGNCKSVEHIVLGGPLGKRGFSGEINSAQVMAVGGDESVTVSGTLVASGWAGLVAPSSSERYGIL
jgi:hypothetical protein